MPFASKNSLLRAGLMAVYQSRGHRLLKPVTRGLGAILMLHRVSPGPTRAFDPNGSLRVTPDFLERSIRLVRREGYDTVSLDEACLRLKEPDRHRPFVCFTLDDGYRDNLQVAYPIFRRHGVPFCIYVPTEFAEGNGELWWCNLEAALQVGRTLSIEIGGRSLSLDCSTPAGQQQAWNRLYWPLRGVAEDEARSKIRALCEQAGVDTRKAGADAIMGWREIAMLASDPLCTIGAHTVHHYSLAKLEPERAREEVMQSRFGLERKLGRPVRHFSYPYGSAADAGPREYALAAEAGFASAVTTRKGLLQRSHAQAMHALPRLSLNGDLQDERLLEVLLGGVPFALVNGLKSMRRLASF